MAKDIPGGLFKGVPFLAPGQIIKVEDDVINSIIRWLKLKGYQVIDHFYYQEGIETTNIGALSTYIGVSHGYERDKCIFYGNIDITFSVNSIAAGTNYSVSYIVSLDLTKFPAQIIVGNTELFKNPGNSKLSTIEFFDREYIEDVLANRVSWSFNTMGTSSMVLETMMSGILFIIK
jgi:hypothetical protein